MRAVRVGADHVGPVVVRRQALLETLVRIAEHLGVHRCNVVVVIARI
jgi:hypothetical protein